MSNPTRELTERPVTPEDERFLFEVYASTRTDELAGFGWPAAQGDAFLTMQYRGRAQSYAAEFPGAEWSVLLADGTAAGSAIVCRSAEEIWLLDISLLPAFRGVGLGGQWIARLAEEAARAGIPLRLNVLNGNRAARLYERLGFVTKGNDGVYAEMELAPGGGRDES